MKSPEKLRGGLLFLLYLNMVVFSFNTFCRNCLWYLFIPLQLLNARPSIQNQELPFELISEVNGLSQSMVNCITQDHYGFIWFGTLKEGVQLFALENIEAMNKRMIENCFAKLKIS